MSASDDSPPSCSKCLESNPHEIPKWIEGVGLNKRTIRSYRCLNHVNYPELNEIRSLIPVYQRIIKSHAKRLRSIPGDVDSNEDEDDREDGLIVKRADLVDEIHRLCAGIVDILSEWAKSPERNAEEKCGCYREIAYFHHLVWKSLCGPDSYSEALKPHMDAAREHYQRYHEYALSDCQEPESHFKIVLGASCSQSKFMWDMSQVSAEPRSILGKVIKLVNGSKSTRPGKAKITD